MNLLDSVEIQKLEEDIKRYAKAYYEGEAKISDYEFDKLTDRLRDLKPDSTVLRTPGWGYEQTGTKVKHKYQIVKSLDKCRTFDEIPERFTNKSVALSPKLDGLTGVFYYKNGRLIKAITRGNGTEGKDITDKARLIVGNEILDKNFTGGVRGELEISNTNWEIIKSRYPEAKNARNLCAGWINSKDYDPDEIKMIDFITYKVTGQEREEGKEDIFYDLSKVDNIGEICFNSNPTKFNVIDWLSYNFKNTIPKVQATLIRDGFQEFMQKVFTEFKTSDRYNLDYELDGIVISDIDVIYHRAENSYIYDECAFKFAAEEKETTVTNIKWELSRTQRYIPVLEIEPVELSGATVHSITGNNAKYLVDNGLGVGAIITASRSGEVIPKHMSTLEAADTNLPTQCPACGHNLEWVGVDLKCVNTECPHIAESDLEQWCTIVGETDGLAWVTMKQYLDKFNIHNIDDLYKNIDTMITTLQGGNASITDKKIVEFLNKLYKDMIPVEKALMGLNIPRLSEQTAKLLNKEKELVHDLMTIGSQYTTVKDRDMISIPDTLKNKLLGLVKEATTESILSNLGKLNTLHYLYEQDIPRIIFNDNTDEIIKVAVTGSLDSMKRSAFEKYIQSYGYELSSSIKSCKYLITNNPNSGSSKNKDAQKYGVEIITEKEFLDKLGKVTTKSNTLF